MVFKGKEKQNMNNYAKERKLESYAEYLGSKALMSIADESVESLYFNGRRMMVKKFGSERWEEIPIDVPHEKILDFVRMMANFAEKRLNFTDGFENAPIGCLVASAKMYGQLYAGEGLTAVFLITRLKDGQRLPGREKEPWEPKI